MALRKQVLSNMEGQKRLSLLNDINNGSDDYSNDIFILNDSPYFDIEQMMQFLKNRKNMFTILSLNVQSLNAKFDEIKILVSKLNDHDLHFSALCFQETWLSQGSDNSFFEINNYQQISQFSSCSRHGGLSIYLYDCFNFINYLCQDNSNIWEGQFIKISYQTAYLYWGTYIDLLITY